MVYYELGKLLGMKMKKFNKKYQMPLTAMFMMPSMLLGLPALRLWITTPKGEPIYDKWIETISTGAPISLLFILILFPLIRTVVTKYLIEPEKVEKK